MTASGLRKAALYLASLAPADQRTLLAALPADARKALRPLIDVVVAHRWNAPELVARALAEDIRGLTSASALSVDALLALAKELPADWTARVLAANTATDPRFLLGLLEPARAAQVREQLEPLKQLPERLRDALLTEAAASVRVAA